MKPIKMLLFVLAVTLFSPLLAHAQSDQAKENANVIQEFVQLAQDMSPAPEQVEACQGKQQNDPCSFQVEGGLTLGGQCQNSSDALACIAVPQF